MKFASATLVTGSYSFLHMLQLSYLQAYLRLSELHPRVIRELSVGVLKVYLQATIELFIAWFIHKDLVVVV